MMSAVPSHHPKYRTKLCRNFSNGNCPFGQKCSFVHPPQGINPLSSSLAQYLFNWNVLLPQILALQQGSVKRMPRKSVPRPQAPQLVDEDPSPPASLLLSTSDSASSEQTSQKRRSNKRKWLPCKQPVRTGGWYQVGEECKLRHGVAVSPADGGKAQPAPPFTIDVYGDGDRAIGGGALTGIQLPPPPVTSQEYSQPPRYTETETAQPYQPLCWPGYAWHSYQPYYPSVSAITTVPMPATIAPSSAAQHNVYRPQPPVQEVRLTETQTSLPLGAYEVNGTTYFPTRMPSIPAPAPTAIPVHPAPYSQTMTLPYLYYVPPPLPASYDAQNQGMEVPPETSFDSFASDTLMPSELPAIRPEDYSLSSIPHGDRPRFRSLPSQNSGLMDNSKDANEQEFPYQPPREQRVGHARRISINIKKDGATGG